MRIKECGWRLNKTCINPLMFDRPGKTWTHCKHDGRESSDKCIFFDAEDHVNEVQ
jgi:hypothetical protein